MEIVKDYELRRCGSKIVLRRFMAPAYEFTTLWVADELVDSPLKELTILKAGEYYALLREKDGQLFYVSGCRSYAVCDGRILICTDMWYWWNDQFEQVLLGHMLGEEHVLFWHKGTEAFYLNCFSKGKLEQFNGKSFEILAGKKADFLWADAAKIETSSGQRYVSVVARSEFDSSPGKKASRYRKVFNVVLTEKPMTSKADYYLFVGDFLRRMSNFATVIGFAEKFRNTIENGKDFKDMPVLLPRWKSVAIDDFRVVILADTYRMYEGCNEGIYLVRCAELNYECKADEVDMGEYGGKRCLFVRHKGIEDKIYAVPHGFRSKLVKQEGAS